jgi:hypothetical protein
MVRTVKSLPQPHELLARLDSFYNDVDEGLEGGVLAAAYYKAAVQATNDRINRLRRGIIVEGILNGVSRAEIFDRLSAEGLVG